MPQKNIDNELEEQTSGALRVARRQYLQAYILSRKADNRIEMQEYGDEARDGRSVFQLSRSAIAASEQTAKLIKNELNRRDEDYQSRQEIIKKARERF
jgi:hypothetical protein